MKLLIIFGPPAVGKATVGRLIESQTDFKLFHNHMVMDGVMHIFGRGIPAEDRLSRFIRKQVIEEAARARINLIFTYVWNFALPKGKQNIDTYKQIYEGLGGEALFVELSAPLEARVERARHPDRWRFKTHAPDPAEVGKAETEKNFTSPSPFFYPDAYHRIDTVGKTAEQVAQEIMTLL